MKYMSKIIKKIKNPQYEWFENKVMRNNEIILIKKIILRES